MEYSFKQGKIIVRQRLDHLSKERVFQTRVPPQHFCLISAIPVEGTQIWKTMGNLFAHLTSLCSHNYRDHPPAAGPAMNRKQWGIGTFSLLQNSSQKINESGCIGMLFFSIAQGDLQQKQKQKCSFPSKGDIYF